MVRRELTQRALDRAKEEPSPYADLLQLLIGCAPVRDGSLQERQAALHHGPAEEHAARVEALLAILQGKSV